MQGRLLSLLAVSSLLAACGTGATVASGPDVVNLDPPAQSLSSAVQTSPGYAPGLHPHVMRRFYSPSGPQAANGAPHLTYYGGPVISNVKVVVVFWTDGVDSTTKDRIAGFYQAVNDSNYFDWLQEYDTSSQHIGRGSYVSSVTITPSTSSSSLTDDQISAELDAQINAGNLPAPDADTLYMTYFPAGYSIDLQGAQSCSYFCAYHNSFSHGGQPTFYGVMPDFTTGGCAQGCGANADPFDNLTSASTHEMIEAVTDADVGGNNIAWYDQDDSGQGEIGDICNGYDDTVSGYVVQQEWSNQRNTCIAYDSTVPTPTPTPPPPTPTPSPTATPGPGNGGGGKGHGILGGCDVAAAANVPAAGSAAAAVLFALGLAVIARRRET